MTQLRLLAMWLALYPIAALGIDFERYHSQDEINGYLRELAADYPDLVTFHILGYSNLGREISYVVISKGDPGHLPGIFMNGTHHGNEKSSTESVLGLAEMLTRENSRRDVDALLRSYAVYIQPLVNPDGHAANTRGDSLGRDPNRDYAFPGRSVEHSFKIPEIQLIKRLLNEKKFRASVAYHSGMEGVLWPGCATAQALPHDTIFAALSRTAALAMGMTLFKQSFFDYPTKGEFTDYAYMANGTLGVTFEVSRRGNPPEDELAAVVQRSIGGALAFMRGIQSIDRGQMPVQRMSRALLSQSTSRFINSVVN